MSRFFESCEECDEKIITQKHKINVSVLNFHFVGISEYVLSKTKMKRCCANLLLINIGKSEAVNCLFCEEERVLSYSVKYRF